MRAIANWLSRQAAFAGLVALALPALTPSVAATSCIAPTPEAISTGALPAAEPDQALFDRAVRAEVNFVRCLEGLHPLSAAPGLVETARTHAHWMAHNRKLDHASTVAGQATVPQRIRAALPGARRGSENIGYVHRYRIDEGEPFFATFEACVYRDARGRTVPRHSYASMARRIVELWMASPGHRANILDRRVERTGAAIAFDGQAAHCGVYYMAQEFAG